MGCPGCGEDNEDCLQTWKGFAESYRQGKGDEPEMEEFGVYKSKTIGEKVIQLVPMTFGKYRLNVGPKDQGWYDNGW